MRQLRAWLAQQSIEALATNYVVMTETMTMSIKDTQPPTAEFVLPRPRIYTLQDLETEIKRRLALQMNIDKPEERQFIIEMAFQDTIEKAKKIYQMLGG